MVSPKLKAYYLASIDHKVETLETARRRLDDPSETTAALEELRDLAHSIKGTGSSFGFPEITEAADAVELGQDETEVRTHLETLLGVLRDIAESADAP